MDQSKVTFVYNLIKGAIVLLLLASLFYLTITGKLAVSTYQTIIASAITGLGGYHLHASVVGTKADKQASVEVKSLEGVKNEVSEKQTEV